MGISLRFWFLDGFALCGSLVACADYRDQSGVGVLLEGFCYDWVGCFHQTNQLARRHAEVVRVVLFAEVAAVNVHMFGEWDLVSLLLSALWKQAGGIMSIHTPKEGSFGWKGFSTISRWSSGKSSMMTEMGSRTINNRGTENSK